MLSVLITFISRAGCLDPHGQSYIEYCAEGAEARIGTWEGIGAFAPAAITGVYTVIEAIVMRNVVIRIAVWASVGFLVSVSWGFYFANANKSIPIEPFVYTFAKLTQPALAVMLYLKPTSPLGLIRVVVANAATYALLGLIATTIRKHHLALHISN